MHLSTFSNYVCIARITLYIHALHITPFCHSGHHMLHNYYVSTPPLQTTPYNCLGIPGFHRRNVFVWHFQFSLICYPFPSFASVFVLCWVVASQYNYGHHALRVNTIFCALKVKHILLSEKVQGGTYVPQCLFTVLITLKSRSYYVLWLWRRQLQFHLLCCITQYLDKM